MKNILLTGGSGLIGTQLTQMLQEKGYNVGNFSRRQRSGDGIKHFVWSPQERKLDDEAIRWADGIIHLAGANVSDQRWTPAYKREIMESRTISTQLIVDKLHQIEHSVQVFVSSSAIGIYGDTGSQLVDEQGPQGDNFMAEVCKQWEAAAEGAPVRTVKIRVGVVLSPKEGALEKMAQPIRLFAGAPLGSGKQYVPWIHLQDIAGIFVHALEHHDMQGVYNGVSPNPTTNADMTKDIAKVLHRPLILPPVPKFALDLLVGEMSSVVLASTRVSSSKIEQAGYAFKFPHLYPALQNLL